MILSTYNNSKLHVLSLVVRLLSSFIETEGSLPCSQDLEIALYSETTE
jgi:hypothetical protein